MMILDSQSRLLVQSTTDLLNGKVNRIVASKDYNDINYKLEYKDNKLYLSFSCMNFKDMYNIAGDYCIQKYYADYTVEQPTPDFDITLSFLTDKLLQNPPKPGKQPTEEEIQTYREKHAVVKAENEKIITKVAADFSSFKRNFYASLYEQAFDKINAGTPLPPFKFQTRENEIVFVISDNGSISLFYEVNFQDMADRTIGHLIITEMIESKRHVKNAPSISVTTLNTDLLVKSYPDLDKVKRNDKSTIVNFTLFKDQHFSKNYEQIASLLSGFRQYLHYHIHASKTYLHSRIVRRINEFNRSLTKCQFEQEDEKRIEDDKQGTVWKNK